MEMVFVFKVFRKWWWCVIYCDQYVSLIMYIRIQSCLRHYVGQTDANTPDKCNCCYKKSRFICPLSTVF